ncbi:MULTISPECIES: hypothetical protein [unclassified Methylobacterium]|uniref:hypothetical protein n=1 Tax=unclassified Methylobacterium TaxID=2615210 RepID=UPI0011C2031D|nr:MULTISPECIES: hypothetical protein [unclassified Methylobacterium]QEE38190.1 hypothetical protein FVA80_03555 [Methylobacterium sp. WL1]TXN55150.1 hypothetical protein FV241_21060 [Methylobacterium sp. WL2]
MSFDFATLAAVVGGAASIVAVSRSIFEFLRLKRDAQFVHSKVIREDKDLIELVINGTTVTIDIKDINKETPEKIDRAIKEINAARHIPNAA